LNFRDKNVLKAFGIHLQLTRKSLGFTQESLAYNAELSLSQIARLETGRGNPTLCTLITIANTLGIEPKVLLDFTVSNNAS
jgi:transcriptional regulator with XRE-family HTH domain